MRGMAREYAAGNSRGPGWHEFSGKLGQLQAGSQAGSGMARSRAMARVNWVFWGRCIRRRAERVSRLGCPLSLKTPNMGNVGQDEWQDSPPGVRSSNGIMEGLMTNHEYDDAYGAGYSRGKEACHAELRAWSPHAPPRCGCEPCQTVAPRVPW